MTASRLALGRQIKGYAALMQARAQWEKQMESMLIDMSFVCTEEGLALHFNPIPLLEQYEAAVSGLERAMTSGVVRTGMYAHAD